MGHTDSKPKGPEAMSLDLVFPGFQNVYGIPERATSLSLRPTNGAHAAAAAQCRRTAYHGSVRCREMPMHVLGGGGGACCRRQLPQLLHLRGSCGPAWHRCVQGRRYAETLFHFHADAFLATG